MLVGWLLDLALAFANWFLNLFGALPTFSFGSGVTLTVPVPLMGSSVAAMNLWLIAGLAVMFVLLVGRMLQWLYALIPFKGT